MGLNGFFSALPAESRRREDCDLSLWWSERHCASQFDRIAQPDGLGVWQESGARRALAEATVPVTTAVLWATQRPHDANWALNGYDGLRFRLAQLAGVPIPPESQECTSETREYRRRSRARQRDGGR